MGFKVPTSATFWAPVTLEATAEDGRHIEGQIRVQFKRKTRDEMKQLIEDLRGKEITAEVVEPYIESWKGYEDENGDAPFSSENLKRMAQMVPGSPMAIFLSYCKASAGAREGN